jgi:hypothetical protein
MSTPVRTLPRLMPAGCGRYREASSVYSLRLPDSLIAEPGQVADELDLPVSALIRGFIMDGLASSDFTTMGFAGAPRTVRLEGNHFPLESVVSPKRKRQRTPS